MIAENKLKLVRLALVAATILLTILMFQLGLPEFFPLIPGALAIVTFAIPTTPNKPQGTNIDQEPSRTHTQDTPNPQEVGSPKAHAKKEEEKRSL
jgi:hypothetical protein